MPSRSQLIRGLRSPKLFLRGANRLYHRRLNSREYNTRGIDIFDEDWDNLIVLDACRYDLFKEENDIDGVLESRESRGSSTQEWLRANFKNKKLFDTVYVTANPQYYYHKDTLNSELHKVDHVWQGEGWDKKYQTVLPEVTTNRALSVGENHPNKRLLVHYMQPHIPFLSEMVSELSEEEFLNPQEPSSWDDLMTGNLKIEPGEIWPAYRDTLNQTLPHVRKLINGLDGKSVVSADHGNMIGERASPFPIREWGHPRGIYTRELVKVPWLEIRRERRRIIPERPVDTDPTESVEDDVRARLRELGYVTE